MPRLWSVSLRICARLSDMAHPIGKLRCMSFHTSSWMTCRNRSQRVGVLARYNVLPWKLFPLYDFPWSHTFDRLRSLKVSHSFVQDASIQAFVGMSSGMTRIISCAALLHARRDLSWDGLHNRGTMQVVPVVFRCFHCQDETGCFPLIPIRAIPVRTRSWNTWVDLTHPDIIHMTLLMLTSTLTCGVLLQTVTRIQAAEKTRACVEFRNVIAQHPRVVPIGHALMTPSVCNLGRNFFMGYLKFSIRSKCTPMYFVAFWNNGVCQRTRSTADSLLCRLQERHFRHTNDLLQWHPQQTFWLAYLQLNALLSKMMGWTIFNGRVEQWRKLISTVQPCTRYPLQNVPHNCSIDYNCMMQHEPMWVQETLTCMHKSLR